MLTLIIFNTLGVWVLVCSIFFFLMDTVVKGNHIVTADVTAIALCWHM